VSARVVCDASALVALLLDSGPDGNWVTEAVAGAAFAAPSLVAFESANIVRRHELARIVSADQAEQAHADLLDLAIEQWPYELLAPRAWELRHNLSSYDAGYVALAELIGAKLVTLDERIGGAPGVRCAIATPPAHRGAQPVQPVAEPHP
jgi:predicted nucleic acid-binding protein